MGLLTNGKIIVITTFALGACSTLDTQKDSQKDSQEKTREIASASANASVSTVNSTYDACKISEKLTSQEKNIKFFLYHSDSLNEVIKLNNSLPSSKVKLELNEILEGRGSQEYVKAFLNSTSYLKFAKEALLSTASFLAPGSLSDIGYRKLESTFLNNCEFLNKVETKKVHALGSIAFAKLNIFKMVFLENDPDKNWSNPWSGFWGSEGDKAQVVLRFSLANPVGPNLSIAEQSLNLEFIPGLGIKFLTSNHRSLDLVAMESLAGQGVDHNYFKYEFSPDFSRHAPSDFNAEENPELKEDILKRYNSNYVNHTVMNLVGKRFFQALKSINNIHGEGLDPADNTGLHPFAMSINELSKYNSNGQGQSVQNKRPWRIIFKPNIVSSNKKIVTSSQTFDYTKVETDFRYKLSYLKPGDKVYDILAEDQNGKRFVIGEIELTTTPLPSFFGDKILFMQHQFENRQLFKESITSP